ncbi:MAG: D-alanine--D-alanine ligase [Planctomycetota bacterium]
MKPTVAVLAGGVSAEHEVSLVSATEVVKALRARGYEAHVVLIGRDGCWRRAGPRRLNAITEPTVASLSRLCNASPAEHAFESLLRLEKRGVQVVFPALHGRQGEDGMIQSCLEILGIAYVGSGVTASAVGMSKMLTRQAFLGASLPMPPAWCPEKREAVHGDPGDLCREMQKSLRFPVFLKADNSGSSLGVERVAKPGDFPAALARVRRMDRYWICEQAMEGVELTCAVLGNSGEQPIPLPPVQITPRHASFFDYEAKYESGASEELCPPTRVGRAEVEAAERLALGAHELLGCRGFSRTDMIASRGGLYLFELNTIPGLTPASLVPLAAREAGLSFEDLVERLIQLAGRRSGARGACLRGEDRREAMASRL